MADDTRNPDALFFAVSETYTALDEGELTPQHAEVASAAACLEFLGLPRILEALSVALRRDVTMTGTEQLAFVADLLAARGQ